MVFLESIIVVGSEEIDGQSYSAITDSDGKYEIIDIKQSDLSVYHTSCYHDKLVEKFGMKFSHSLYDTYYSHGSETLLSMIYNIELSCGQNLQYDVALKGK